MADKIGDKRRTDIKREYVYRYLLSNPCVDCGENDPVVLEFDHVGRKSYGINRLITNNCSLDRLVAEIAQCQMRCANCHRRKTIKQFGSYRLR
jgi:hypothetical protein